MYQEFYNSGQLKFEVEIVDGRKNGPAKKYFESGIVHYEANFLRDTINGPYIEYHESGEIESLAFFEMGKRQGEVIDYFENGNLEGYRFLKNDTAVYLKKFSPDGRFDWFMIKVEAVKFTQDDGVRYWFRYPYSSLDSTLLLAVVTTVNENAVKDTIYLKVETGLTLDLTMPTDIAESYAKDSLVFEICELRMDSSMTNVVALVPEEAIQTDTMYFVTRTDPNWGN